MGAALEAMAEANKSDEQKEKETNDALNSLFTLAHTYQNGSLLFTDHVCVISSPN